jgi:hypothetical protein
MFLNSVTFPLVMALEDITNQETNLKWISLQNAVMRKVISQYSPLIEKSRYHIVSAGCDDKKVSITLIDTTPKKFFGFFKDKKQRALAFELLKKKLPEECDAYDLNCNPTVIPLYLFNNGRVKTNSYNL